jgi:hypothetical protein
MNLGGLKESPRDPRTFQLGAITSLPKLSELPDFFYYTPLEVKDQGDSDKCSAYATDAVSELQEGVVLDPHWGFAASKEISGDPDEWGQAILPALKRHTSKGALELSESPKLTFRNLKDWPNLAYNALKHTKKSYVEITGPYDEYDNVRATIWKYREEKRGAVMGLYWHWGTDYILKGAEDKGFGHLIAIIGWDKDGLVVQNSAGKRVGIEGMNRLPREEANYYIKKFNGAFMFVDYSPEEIKHVIEKGIKLEQLNLLSKALVLMKKLIAKLNGNIKETAGFVLETVEAIYSDRN